MIIKVKIMLIIVLIILSMVGRSRSSNGSRSDPILAKMDLVPNLRSVKLWMFPTLVVIINPLAIVKCQPELEFKKGFILFQVLLLGNSVKTVLLQCIDLSIRARGIRTYGLSPTLH